MRDRRVISIVAFRFDQAILQSPTSEVRFEYSFYRRVDLRRFGVRANMLTGQDLTETRKNAEGKNKEKIYCTFCPSKILNAGAASLVNMEVSATVITR